MEEAWGTGLGELPLHAVHEAETAPSEGDEAHDG